MAIMALLQFGHEFDDFRTMNLLDLLGSMNSEPPQREAMRQCQKQQPGRYSTTLRVLIRDIFQAVLADNQATPF